MSGAQRLFQVAEMQWIEHDRNIEKNRDTEMQKHDRAWPFCWARETATSATFYVGIYDRHTYAVVTSPQWSSNSQAGSAYDTVVWHWKILEMDAQFLQSYCMLLWNALMPAIFRHTQDISRWPWTTTIENKLLLQRRLCVFLTIFFLSAELITHDTDLPIEEMKHF